MHKSDKFKLMDIGCGDGVLLYLISQKFKEYNLILYGIDSSKEALNTAKQKVKKA
ncbi:MAG: class I SAM-dependent methyltransferase [Candidatus Hermodarchaeota archaeon]